MDYKIKFYLLLTLIWLLLSGCVSIEPVYYEQEVKTADEAITKFHQLLDEENYEGLYSLTHEKARATKSKDAFMQLMKHIHTQFGKVQNSFKVDAKTTSQADSTLVELIYQTKFEEVEKKEKFVWIVADKKAGLFSYEIVQ